MEFLRITAAFIVCHSRRCHRRRRLGNSHIDKIWIKARRTNASDDIVLRLTDARDPRSLHSSSVAIDRHSSTAASSHVDRASSSRSSGDGEKRPYTGTAG
jgi:hypothetical protein